jgi:hypothetical protein
MTAIRELLCECHAILKFRFKPLILFNKNLMVACGQGVRRRRNCRLAAVFAGLFTMP